MATGGNKLTNPGQTVDLDLQRSLLMAIDKGAPEFTEILLKTGADVDYIFKGSDTPLQLVIKNRSMSLENQLLLSRFLLAYGADVNLMSENDASTPLTLAIHTAARGHKQLDLVNLFLENGADPDIVNYRIFRHGERYKASVVVLQVAINYAFKAGVQRLLEAGATVDLTPKYGETSLQLGVLVKFRDLKDQMDIIKLLIQYKANPVFTSMSHTVVPMMLAIRGHADNPNAAEIVRFLLECGTDPNILNKDECTKVERIGYVPSLKTALQDAVKYSWTGGVQILLEAGADPNLLPEHSYLPLELALDSKVEHQVNILRLLFKHGADVKRMERGTLLVLAMRKAMNESKDKRIVRVLLENRADPNEVDTSKYVTPVSRVISHLTDTNKEISLELFRELVDFGADVNFLSRRTMPFLHEMIHMDRKAHMKFHQEHLEDFFRYGGDVSAVDYDLGSGMQYALKERSHGNNVRWMIRHGAATDWIQPYHLIEHFMPSKHSKRFGMIPLMFFKGGMPMPKEAFECLVEMETMIHTLYQQVLLWPDTEEARIYADLESDSSDDEWKYNLDRDMTKIKKKLSALFKDREDKAKARPIHPVNFKTQMDDLLTFSDESLHEYPPDEHIDVHEIQWRTGYQNIVQTVEWLRKPRTLQWRCRHVLRENLVTLHPSVIKLLPGPPSVKRFILCHDL